MRRMMASPSPIPPSASFPLSCASVYAASAFSCSSTSASYVDGDEHVTEETYEIFSSVSYSSPSPSHHHRPPPHLPENAERMMSKKNAKAVGEG